MQGIIANMEWQVQLHPSFEPEFLTLPQEAQDELLAKMLLLQISGPNLRRPHVDTLNGSRHSNMKEIRFNADDGVWRVAFAFDSKRKAILLVAGDKSGGSQKQFYKQLIDKADLRFNEHLSRLELEENDN
jgi:hypothetical protein